MAFVTAGNGVAGSGASVGGTVAALSGNDLYLVGALVVQSTTTVSGITVNGVAASIVATGSNQAIGAATFKMVRFVLDDPTAGAITASFDASAVSYLAWEVHNDITGHAGTGQGFNSSTLADPQSNDVTVTVGDDVVDFFFVGNNQTATALGTQTSAYTPTAQNSRRLYSSYLLDAAANPQAMGWDPTGTTDGYIQAGFALTPVATTSAAVTGTLATPPIVRSDIVAGGKTIIITLTGDTFVASFASIQDDLTDGCDAGNATANGWNETVRDAVVNPITWVRTSATVATGTLAAVPSYAPAATQTITVTLPASALTGGVPIVATPTIVTLVGPLLSAYSGTTDASGVVAITLTSDDPLTTDGEILQLTAVCAGVTSRTSARPATP